jgi:hypothetical protein
MNFDEIHIAECVNPNAVPLPDTCGDIPDPLSCSNPLYAATHPGECLTAPRLIVKPDYAIREVGKTIEYRAFLWLDGEEVELTEGVTWNTSNIFAAVIGSSGHATAMGVGIVTVSAAYGYLYGYAQLEVIAAGECSVDGNGYVLLIDNSESSVVPFSGTYPSRLAFAKEQAKRFLDNVDFSKDTATIASFNASGAIVLSETSDVVAAKAAVDSIAQTLNTTDIQSGLESAYGALVTGRRVIILFSDGENKEGNNPVDYAISIRNASNFIMVVGLRAYGTGFKLLNRIANGGFFLNALPSNEDSISTWLAGLQSYICSGSCGPSGDVIVGTGSLNYTAFEKWTVTDGRVDLIGKNTGGPELFDVWPGNELYVDMCGSDGLGTMQTKDGLITLAAGAHSIEIVLAGNGREDRTPDVMEVSIYDGSDTLIHTEDITFTDYLTPFTAYTIDFTVGVGNVGPGAYIKVRQ